MEIKNTPKMPEVFKYMASGSDLWLTPKYAVNILIPYLEKFRDKIIWCPFDTEESEFVIILKACKFKVIYSHLENNQNFFNYEPEKWDVIVSNPPWSIKDKVLKRCYDFNKPFVLLLPIHALGGKFRWGLFNDGNIQLLISRKRIRYNHILRKGKLSNPPFESAYFCWKFLPTQVCFEKV